ncbi:MAG TPA: hypothetical protein H9671_06530 [Firmicutes bacterium]|nr:hypothetical protein [Bacillota bacterium]
MSKRFYMVVMLLCCLFIFSSCGQTAENISFTYDGVRYTASDIQDDKGIYQYSDQENHVITISRLADQDNHYTVDINGQQYHASISYSANSGGFLIQSESPSGGYASISIRKMGDWAELVLKEDEWYRIMEDGTEVLYGSYSADEKTTDTDIAVMRDVLRPTLPVITFSPSTQESRTNQIIGFGLLLLGVFFLIRPQLIYRLFARKTPKTVEPPTETLAIIRIIFFFVADAGVVLLLLSLQII